MNDFALIPETGSGQVVGDLFNNQQKLAVRKWRSAVVGAIQLVLEADRRLALQLFAFQLLSGVGYAVSLIAAKQALTAITSHEGDGSIVPFAIGAIAAGIIRLTTGMQGHRTQLLMIASARIASDRVARAAIAADLAKFEDPEFFNELTRADMSGQVHPQELAQGVVGLTSDAISLVAVAWTLAFLEPLLLPIVLAAAVPSWLVKRRAALAEHRHHFGLTDIYRRREYFRSLLLSRENAKELRGLAIGDFLRSQMDAITKHLMLEQRRLQRTHVRLLYVSFAVSLVATVGVLGTCLLLIRSGWINTATAAAAIAAAYILATRLDGALSSLSKIFEASLFWDDFERFVGVAPSDTTSQEAPAFEALEASHLSFTYPGAGTPALRDVSISIRPGEVIALVGENGSGKTTLAKLLAGLYSPDEGEVRWNGEDLRGFDPATIRKQVGLIFQDFARFKVSALDNIWLGDVTQPRDLTAVEVAAREAGIIDVLKSLPNGLNTLLTTEFTGGTDLSGGQWQRIAVARVLFRGTPLIFLDEPTASLDPRAERDFFDSMRELAKNHAVFLISHRFGSVRNADRIYVLRNGELDDQGTHSELMERDGLYAELFRLQASSYLDVAEINPVTKSAVAATYRAP